MKIEAMHGNPGIKLTSRCSKLVFVADTVDDEIFLAAIERVMEFGGTTLITPSQGRQVKSIWPAPVSIERG